MERAPLLPLLGARPSQTLLAQDFVHIETKHARECWKRCCPKNAAGRETDDYYALLRDTARACGLATPCPPRARKVRALCPQGFIEARENNVMGGIVKAVLLLAAVLAVAALAVSWLLQTVGDRARSLPATDVAN